MPVLEFSSEIKLPRDRKAATNKQANTHRPMKGEQRAKANSLKTYQEPFILFSCMIM